MPKQLLPKNGLIYSIERKDIDSSKLQRPNTSILIVGYPHGKFVNNNEPTVYEGKTTQINLPTGTTTTPDFFFDSKIVGGVSGSPVFELRDSLIKLVGIVSQETNEDSVLKNTKTNSAAIFFYYALKMIDILDYFQK